MKIGKVPYNFFKDEVLDPRRLNANFKDAARKINSTIDKRHCHSTLTLPFRLTGASDSAELRRFIIKPPVNVDIISAHLVGHNLADGDEYKIQWFVGNIEYDGSGYDGVAAAPDNGPSATWDYITMTGDGTATQEEMNARNLRLRADSKYAISVTAAADLTSTKDLYLNLLIRTDRFASTPTRAEVDGIDGSATDSASEVTTRRDSLQTSRDNSVSSSNQNMLKAQCFVARAVDNTTLSNKWTFYTSGVDTDNDTYSVSRLFYAVTQAASVTQSTVEVKFGVSTLTSASIVTPSGSLEQTVTVDESPVVALGSASGDPTDEAQDRIIGIRLTSSGTVARAYAILWTI